MSKTTTVFKIGDRVRSDDYGGMSGIVTHVSLDCHTQIQVDGKIDTLCWLAPGTAYLVSTAEELEIERRKADEEAKAIAEKRAWESYQIADTQIGVTTDGDKISTKADDYEFVQAPKHYNAHPAGVECQQIIRECKDPMVAFAMKHLWRSQWGMKPGQSAEQDIAKAIEYLQLQQAKMAGVPRI